MRIILRDDRANAWLTFDDAREVVPARRIEDVARAIEHVAARVNEGAWAAGFVTYEAAAAFDAALTTRAPGRLPLVVFGIFDAPRRGMPAPPPGACTIGPWSRAITRDTYLAAIERIRAHIAAGDTYQVNYTLRQHAAFDGNPGRFFARMVETARPRYGAFVDAGRFAIASLSPELFFTLENGVLSSAPMKGTEARALSVADDEAAAQRLSRSEKNRAENVMIVDMVRNDIGRIARAGSVHVPSLFAVERHATVWQMTSTVAGDTGAGLAEVMRALFPPASVTGAPKRRAMEIIAELEETPRGIYTGCIGFVAPACDGAGPRAQFNVAIRTVTFDRESGRAEYGTGSGIVWESVASDEWLECETKTRVLAMEWPSFRLLETLRWDPAGEPGREGGYSLLEEHLRRLCDSARYFQFDIDPDAARDALRELSRTLPAAPHRVRLLVDRAGRCGLEHAPLHEPSGDRVRLALAAGPVDSSSVFLYHKTTQRSLYDAALAAHPGVDDVLLYNRHGEITETCIANVCLCIDGAWVTPPVSSGLLPGVLRAQLLAEGRISERVLAVSDLSRASAIAVVNSVRGWRDAEMVSPLGAEANPVASRP